MTDYYQLELDDMVIALNNKDADIELLQKKLDIAIKALKDIQEHTKEFTLPSYTGMVCYKSLKEIDLVGTLAKEDA